MFPASFSLGSYMGLLTLVCVTQTLYGWTIRVRETLRMCAALFSSSSSLHVRVISLQSGHSYISSGVCTRILFSESGPLDDG